MKMNEKWFLGLLMINGAMFAFSLLSRLFSFTGEWWDWVYMSGLLLTVILIVMYFMEQRKMKREASDRT